MMSLWARGVVPVAVIAASAMAPALVRAQGAPCPAAKDLPLLTIHDAENPAIPIIDQWQVYWGGIPISDAQLARLSGRDPLIERTTNEMRDRGMKVYLWMGVAGVGAATSMAGWVFYGQNNENIDQGLALSFALGGLLVGVFGSLMVNEAIVTPLEPHMAPTPKHRFTRRETRSLVAEINKRLYRDTCQAARDAQELISSDLPVQSPKSVPVEPSEPP